MLLRIENNSENNRQERWRLVASASESSTASEPIVEPPNKGHFGNGSFVLCSEVVPISE